MDTYTQYFEKEDLQVNKLHLSFYVSKLHKIHQPPQNTKNLPLLIFYWIVQNKHVPISWSGYSTSFYFPNFFRNLHIISVSYQYNITISCLKKSSVYVYIGYGYSSPLLLIHFFVDLKFNFGMCFLIFWFFWYVSWLWRSSIT